MSEAIKFDDNEISSLKELQDGYLSAQSQFGQIAIARMNLRKQADELSIVEEEAQKRFVDLQKKERDLVDELTKKYGEGSLDPKTGEFTPVKKSNNQE
tara:strand:+ start:55 stop:348 length:294 start_codon:yes stop_codon:yes gene_type:complete